VPVILRRRHRDRRMAWSHIPRDLRERGLSCAAKMRGFTRNAPNMREAAAWVRHEHRRVLGHFAVA
jgi:hypothetical protein